MLIRAAAPPTEESTKQILDARYYKWYEPTASIVLFGGVILSPTVFSFASELLWRVHERAPGHAELCKPDPDLDGSF